MKKIVKTMIACLLMFATVLTGCAVTDTENVTEIAPKTEAVEVADTMEASVEVKNLVPITGQIKESVVITQAPSDGSTFVAEIPADAELTVVAMTSNGWAKVKAEIVETEASVQATDMNLVQASFGRGPIVQDTEADTETEGNDEEKAVNGGTKVSIVYGYVFTGTIQYKGDTIRIEDLDGTFTGSDLHTELLEMTDFEKYMTIEDPDTVTGDDFEALWYNTMGDNWTAENQDMMNLYLIQWGAKQKIDKIREEQEPGHAEPWTLYGITEEEFNEWRGIETEDTDEPSNSENTGNTGVTAPEDATVPETDAPVEDDTTEDDDDTQEPSVNKPAGNVPDNSEPIDDEQSIPTPVPEKPSVPETPIVTPEPTPTPVEPEPEPTPEPEEPADTGRPAGVPEDAEQLANGYWRNSDAIWDSNGNYVASTQRPTGVPESAIQMLSGRWSDGHSVWNPDGTICTS